MILPFLLLLQGTVIYDDLGDAPPVPAAAQQAYGTYLACLTGPLEPVIEGQVPETAAARNALVRTTLASCYNERRVTVAGMEKVVPHTGAWATRAQRMARIEEIIGKAEQRLSFMIVSPDEYRAMVGELWACMKAGGGDSCEPKPVREDRRQ